MKLNKLPGTRGSFTAKTAKKTRMFVYQVNGSESDIQQYMLAKESEGYPAIIDETYGPLFLTSRNLGIEATMDVITDKETGNLRIIASNPKIRDAEEKRGILSESTVDQLLLDALTVGMHAKAKIIRELNEELNGNDDTAAFES